LCLKALTFFSGFEIVPTTVVHLFSKTQSKLFNIQHFALDMVQTDKLFLLLKPKMQKCDFQKIIVVVGKTPHCHIVPKSITIFSGFKILPSKINSTVVFKNTT